ncbi:hypothetical protein BVRB_2g025780 [Beta vulgaris subsp. vulgaris]|nr:hypothetical protein BVRB_2g025780 [Beta vulgaris subsp. vulgaris]
MKKANDKFEEPLPEFPQLKFKDLPPESRHALLETVIEGNKTSQGLICNTFDELEDSSAARVQQILSIPIFPIGPLHKHSPASVVSTCTEDQSSFAWLNTQMPILYCM